MFHKFLPFLLLMITQTATSALASDIAVSLGPGQGTLVGSPDTGAVCPGSSIFTNTDGSYENAYAWQYAGEVAPYYGAFAEGYSGTGTICGLQLALTTLPGYFTDQPLDAYVWSAGGANPGLVLSVTTGIHISPPALWPSVATQNIDITDTSVSGGYFVGFWGNWPGQRAGWYLAADLNGFGGQPRTNIAPGNGFPTGWQDVSVAFGPTQALGIGVIMVPGNVLYAGLSHTVLGQAQLAFADSTLTISNLGSSGNDGVSVATGQNKGWHGWFQSYHFPDTGSLEADVTARGPSAPSTVAGVLQITNLGGGLKSIRASVGGATHYTVDAYLNDQLMRHLTGYTGFPQAQAPGFGSAHDRSLIELLIVVGILDLDGVHARIEPGPVMVEALTLAPASIQFADGSQVDCDHLILTPEDPASVYDTIEQVDLKGVSIPPITLNEEAVSIFGHKHEALGPARLDPAPADMLVSNFGSGGQGSVHIQSPVVVSKDDDKNMKKGSKIYDDAATIGLISWSPVDPSGSAGTGSILRGEASGYYTGQLVESLGWTEIAKRSAGSFGITADLSMVGSLTQRVQVYSGGALLGDFPHHTGEVGTASGWPCGMGRFGESNSYLWTGWNTPVQITINNMPFTGDELRILPENGPSYVLVSDITIQASGIPELAIVGEVFPPPDPAGVAPPVSSQLPAGFDAPWPNPTSGATTLRFRAPSAGRLTASVFDPAGRLVRCLTKTAVEPGELQLTWDGRADDGVPVPAGVYFVRGGLEGRRQPGGLTSRRVVVVR